MPQVRKRSAATPKPSPARPLPHSIRPTLPTAIAALLAETRPATFLQIGGFNGVLGDPLRAFVAEGHLQGVIVEPLPGPFAELQALYADTPAIRLAPCAVADENGERALWRFKPEAVADGRLGAEFSCISSFRMDMLLADAGTLGRLFDPAQRALLRGLAEAVPVTTRTVPSLIEEHGLSKLDVLQIDTKGYDLQVLRLFDFKAQRPRIVHYEHAHLLPTERAEADALLRGFGYTTYPQHDDTLALLRVEAPAPVADRADFDGLLGNVIFCCWTGTNAMSPDRAEALLSVYGQSCCPVLFLTPHNIGEWELPAHPFHPAFPLLSETHKADYLRGYLMHHFGGGYTDLKRTHRSWVPFFDQLRRTPEAVGLGYREIGPIGVAPCGEPLESELRREYAQLIGNCAYIFRRRSAFTTQWIETTHRVLDSKLEALRANPARHPMDQTGIVLPDGTVSAYPLRWAEMLGELFHPLVYQFKDVLIQADIAPSFQAYR